MHRQRERAGGTRRRLIAQSIAVESGFTVEPVAKTLVLCPRDDCSAGIGIVVCGGYLNSNRLRDCTMGDKFPAVGHRYLVDFKQFRVELYFASVTSMTYTVLGPDGSRDGSETVSITVEPIRDMLFLVTWQEADKTTVVHLEDYKNNTIITNITDPKENHAFLKFHGTMTLIS